MGNLAADWSSGSNSRSIEISSEFIPGHAPSGCPLRSAQRFRAAAVSPVTIGGKAVILEGQAVKEGDPIELEVREAVVGGLLGVGAAVPMAVPTGTVALNGMRW